MNRDDFDSFQDNRKYWVEEDSLRCLDQDIYFSVASRYYCAADCSVCYIKHNLETTKKLDLYKNVEFLEETWLNVFSYFNSIRTNDDYFYLKHNYPEIYKWYIDHSDIFELCVTDISLIRVLSLSDLKIKNFADVSISTDFVKKIGEDRLIQYLEYANNKYGISKLKYIDCGGGETIFKKINEWANFNIEYNCVHDDFREDRNILNSKWFDYQNTWVEHTDSKLLTINRETVHLYNTNFFFSSDDASDVSIQPFHVIEDSFNPNKFLPDMLRGKQELYKQYIDLSNIDKFRNYFSETQNYKVNDEYNFIPNIMYSKTSRFFNRIIENGWVKTKLGLYLPSNNVKSIMEAK